MTRSWATLFVLSLSICVAWGCGEQDTDIGGPEIRPGQDDSTAPDNAVTAAEQPTDPQTLQQEAPGVFINGLTQATAEKNTFIGSDNFIEIDEIFNPDYSVTPFLYPAEDANLVETIDPIDPGDPADGSPNRRFPCAQGVATPADGDDCGGAYTYVDWDTLAFTPFDINNHRLSDLDINDQSNPDATSFPRKAGCVAESQVLSKMNLIDAGAANNEEMAYLMVRRENNNGDAGWYWIFSRVEPTLTAGTGPCKPNEEELLFDLTPGDVLVKGQFHPSDDLPLIEVFKTTSNPNDPSGVWYDVSAQGAIDYTNTALWSPSAEVNGKPSVRAAAVNTTPTDPGAWGLEGFGAIVSGNSGPALDIELVSEAAFDLDLFRNPDTCDAVAWGTVITRPSGSGGPNPDLKDLIAPTKLNFIKADATAKVAETCGSDFEVWTEDSDGQSLAGVECKWAFSCTGGTPVVDAALGSFDTANCFSSSSPELIPVTLADPVNGSASCTASLSARASGSTIAACSVDSDSDPVDVRAPVDVTPSAAPLCEDPGAPDDAWTGTFNYSVASESGGDGQFSYAWAFSGPGDTNPTDSTSASGSVDVSQAGALAEYTAALTLSDSRGCSITKSTTAAPLPEPFADMSLTAQCDESFDYAAILTDSQGNTDPDVECKWTIACAGENTTTFGYSAAACASGNHALQALSGEALCDVKLELRNASGPAELCYASDDDSVTIYKAMAVEIATAPQCTDPDGPGGTYTGQFDYNLVSLTGGNGTYTYDWSFSGPGSTMPTPALDPSSTTSGTVYVTDSGSTALYTASLQVSDTDGCTATDDSDVTPLSEPSVTVTTTPSCEPEFSYSGALSDSMGRSVPEVECAWAFSCTDGSPTPTDLAFSLQACDAGLVSVASIAATGANCSATISVRNPASIGPEGICSTGDSQSLAVYQALQLGEIGMQGTCNMEFFADALAAGGSGSYDYEWQFTPTDKISGLATRSGTTTGSMSETVSVLEGNLGYGASLSIVDNRTDLPGACTTQRLSDPVTVYAPLAFDLGEVSDSALCVASDSGVFSAVNVTGGDGSYTYSWGVTGCPTGTETDCLGTGCDASSTTCEIDPPDNQFCPTLQVGLSIDDGTALCAAAGPKYGQYDKTTTVVTSISP